MKFCSYCLIKDMFHKIETFNDAVKMALACSIRNTTSCLILSITIKVKVLQLICQHKMENLLVDFHCQQL